MTDETKTKSPKVEEPDEDSDSGLDDLIESVVEVARAPFAWLLGDYRDED